MKTFLGQYGKFVILMIVIIPVLTFLLSTGEGSFQSKMPEPEVKYESNNSSELVSDISKRNPPTVTITTQKLVKGQKYQFSSPEFIDFTNQDGTKENTTLKVKQVIDPKGNEVLDPNAEFTARKGIYKVKYQVTELYKSSKRTTIKDASFVCD